MSYLEVVSFELAVPKWKVMQTEREIVLTYATYLFLDIVIPK